MVNPLVDPTWRFMTLDWDGKIRMDCSSPSAMASLVAQKDAYDIATGNDADADRHGIVTPDAGLMNPNHYLAVAIDYLFSHRPGWPAAAGIGKTAVSSSMIDRVAGDLGAADDQHVGVLDRIGQVVGIQIGADDAFVATRPQDVDERVGKRISEQDFHDLSYGTQTPAPAVRTSG